MHPAHLLPVFTPAIKFLRVLFKERFPINSNEFFKGNRFEQVFNWGMGVGGTGEEVSKGTVNELEGLFSL